jgi:dienelactone hydrolase
MFRGSLLVAGITAIIVTTTVPALAEIRTENVEYQSGSVKAQGVVFWDDAITGKRPGVLVVHEWWGLDDYAKSRARKLAEAGYVAFACDMYGEGKTTNHPKDASAMATNVRSNQQEWLARGKAALGVLKSRPEVNLQKLAAIGYCFGGTTVLQLALDGADLDAVVSYHGALPAVTLATAAKIQSQVLVCHGAEDTFIPKEAVESFQAALKEAKTKFEFISYPGAKHSFTVPDAGKHGIEGMKYDAAADQASWDSTLKLFQTIWK